MSIFSSIRKSRQQAKEHKSKLAEQNKKEETQEPYRHVPTHAATDAFASAPPSWRENMDRPRIMEQNRRRSAMAASGHNMNMPGVPRIGSSLSYVSYPGNQPPRMRMPRAYSAMAISPYSSGNRDIIYSIPDVAQSEPVSLKDYSPVESNSGSTSSHDDLEMARTYRPPPVIRPASIQSKAHRLHPSNRSRRTSDASVERGAPAAGLGQPGRPQESRIVHPPRSSSMYGPPPTWASHQVGTAPQPLDAKAIAPEAAGRTSGYTDTFRSADSQRASSFSKPDPVSSSTKQAQNLASYPEDPKDRQVPRAARFTELEPADSHKNNDSANEDTSAPISNPPQALNSFPELALESREPPLPAKSKSKKLTKGGGKLLKKNR